MAKNEKMRKLDVEEVKGVSGGTIYWAEENGKKQYYVPGEAGSFTSLMMAQRKACGQKQSCVLKQLDSWDAAAKAARGDHVDGI